MTHSNQKNKIASINLNDETHQVMKKWAEYQGTTMPKLATALLEQMQPVLQQMITTYEEILEGRDENEALNQLLMKGVEHANNQINDKEQFDVTDKRQGD